MATAFQDRREHLASDMLGQPDSRPGIEGTAYDTAWLASVPEDAERRASRFPTSLHWLVQHQNADGSWGGDLPYHHDRVLSTLAALPPLKAFGRRAADAAAVQAGTRYLWQYGRLVASEPMELVGFELLLPALIERVRACGIAVPPQLDGYARQREEKLRLVPSSAIYAPDTTLVHSLEFLGDAVDQRRLPDTQGANGAIGNSPAATAYFYSRVPDPAAERYLQASLSRTGGAMAPVLYPCETFELLWAAYHLYLAGVPASKLLRSEERTLLLAGLRSNGVSLSPSFPIPDADDTAVALLLLHDLGEAVDAAALQPFEHASGHFVSFPIERHASVGVNVHVLHALLRVPGYPDQAATVERLTRYLAEQHGGLYWLDKWHISPYYATAHALLVLAELPDAPRAAMRPLVRTSLQWLRETQNTDGSWGFYGRPTAEETAYALLALASTRPEDADPRDCQRTERAAHYLRVALSDGEAAAFPPQWIDKCLYTPTLVVRAVINAALVATQRHRLSLLIAS
jgi:halimadienyl-diphosphate synthase